MAFFNLNLKYKDLKELVVKFKKASPTTKIILVIVFILASGFVVKTIFNISIYAPQSVGDNSSGIIQVQGENNYVNNPPLFELTYKVLEEKRVKENIYLTTYEVKVKRLSGNFQEGFNVLYDKGKKNCSINWTGSEALEQNGRQIFENQIGEIKCTSMMPIVNNGKLFTVEGVDKYNP